MLRFLVPAACVGFAASSIALSTPAATVPSVDQLVQSVAAYFDDLRRIRFTAVTEDQCRSHVGAHPLSRIESEVSRDNDSWRVFVESTEHRQGKNGDIETSTQVYEFFWLPSTGFRQFNYTGNTCSSITARTQRNDLLRDVGMHNYLPLITGHVLGTSETLVDLLTQAKPQVRQVRENERAFYVLENETAWGFTAVWLDPTQNGLPLRIRHVKGLNHLIGLAGRPLGELPKDGDGAAIQSYESLEPVS